LWFAANEHPDPAEWISFFKAVGELYTGKGPFPSNDERHFPVPKFMKAVQDGHDVVLVSLSRELLLGTDLMFKTATQAQALGSSDQLV